jgi:hypothetical protein
MYVTRYRAVARRDPSRDGGRQVGQAAGNEARPVERSNGIEQS